MEVNRTSTESSLLLITDLFTTKPAARVGRILLTDRQIGTGGIDIEQGGLVAEPESTSQASPLGYGYAKKEESTGVIREVLCFTVSECSATARQRAPEDFAVRVSADSEGLTRAAFDAKVAALEGWVVTTESEGQRFDTVKTDLEENGFQDSSELRAWKIFRSDADPSTADEVGYGIIAEVASEDGEERTEQHWVWFDGGTFDKVRCVADAGGYASVSAFLSAMAQRSGSGAVHHAYERAVHRYELRAPDGDN